MAAPTKQKLEYFSFDVDFFSDEKIEAISGEFGIKGEIVTVKLLCAIYRNGYFIEWSEMLKMKLLKNLPGITKELLEQIIQRLVKWNFFNESLFNSDKILTSTGIQKRFEEATKRRKSTNTSQYWLLNEVNVNINNSSSRINVNINSQSKVKESKVNKPKESEDVNLVSAGSPYSKNDFLNDWNELRTKHLKKPSFVKNLSADDLSNLKKLMEDYEPVNFREALEGLFRQRKMPNGNSTMQSNPKHFLTHFNAYLTAYHDKNTSLYGKAETEKTL